MQAEIEAALEKVCSLVPSTYRADCNAFVQEYTPEIIKLILSEVSPSEVCSALGLCSSIEGRSWTNLMEWVGSNVIIPWKLVSTLFDINKQHFMSCIYREWMIERR